MLSSQYCNKLRKGKKTKHQQTSKFKALANSYLKLMPLSTLHPLPTGPGKHDTPPPAPPPIPPLTPPSHRPQVKTQILLLILQHLG